MKIIQLLLIFGFIAALFAGKKRYITNYIHISKHIICQTENNYINISIITNYISCIKILFPRLSLCVCLDVGINFSSSINTLIKLFLLVETEQADEDQDEADEDQDETGGYQDEADPSNELKEEDELENPTEVDDNDDESGIIFKDFRFVFAALL